MRVFISIDIPDKIKKEMEEIQKNLPEFVGKKIEFENLHLTLKFLGEIDKEMVKKVDEALRKIKFRKFYVEIDEIGVFSTNFIRIIWIHLSSQELLNLQKKIDKSLEQFFEKERRFMSHVTIARVKNLKDKREFLEKLKKIPVPKKKFLIEDFKLKESILTETGPIYKTLSKYNLE